MAQIDDGGPAFPSQYAVQFPGTPDERLLEPLCYGMTLRAYAAVHLAAGFCAGGEYHDFNGDTWAERSAERAVRLADALIAELSKKPEGK